MLAVLYHFTDTLSPDIAQFKPSEGTTNPSLLFLAAQQPEHAGVLTRTVEYIRSLDRSLTTAEKLDRGVEYLAVQFGTEIYKLTGGISTEADVTLSFNTAATVAAALRIIDLYKENGVPKEAVRVKISATWEGIQASRVLENEHGVSTLVTVVFSLTQVIAAAEAGATCVAPYVGRIGDWYLANGDKSGRDRGIERTQEMQNYLRKYNFKTKVMGASFRTVDQIVPLAGIDYLTIVPSVLRELEKSEIEVQPQLTTESGKCHTIWRSGPRINRVEAAAADLPKISYINNESAWRWAFNSDACAVEKSAEAMRKFAEDTESLKALIAKHLQPNA